MNEDLRELYQEVIIDHGRKPRNFGKMAAPTHQLEGYNPLCGDELVLYIKLDAQQVIKELSFTGTGCAISMASASLMTQRLKGVKVEEALTIFSAFHDLVTGVGSNDHTSEPGDKTDLLGKLSILSGVSEFPARVKCATLSWHTLSGALEGCHCAATTE